MSAEQSDSGEEPWLSREEIIEREHQARLRRCAELQRRIEERRAKAAADDLAAHPWRSDPGMCYSVPVGRLVLPDLP
jgi:hypothetical protein